VFLVRMFWDFTADLPTTRAEKKCDDAICETRDALALRRATELSFVSTGWNNI
jgi:hypothetical protein